MATKKSWSVRKSPPVLVAPCSQTPLGTLPLSSIDRMEAVRVFVDFLTVFDGRSVGGVQKPMLSAPEALKAALSEALVTYHPIAGRLVRSEQGDLEVACTGDGVWFVEASSDCTLDEVNGFEPPLAVAKDDLLPHPPPEVKQDELVFMMQVTQLRCRGFVVGISFNHSVFDGVGAAQFLKAIADIARGHGRPTTNPVWCRDAIPNSPKFPPGPLPSFAAFPFETAVFDLGADAINRVKNQYVRETGQRCSSFDVATALLWQCRTRAIDVPHEAGPDVRLGFAANARHLLQEVLPGGGDGYYGNCVFPVGITAPRGDVSDASVVEVVSMIRDAKERLAGKFMAWMTRETEEDPYRVPLDYGTCVVADWNRVGFLEVDYGWGQPIHVAPLNDESNLVASCIFLRPPAPKQGVRLLARCVTMEHLDALHEQAKKLNLIRLVC